MEKLGKYQLIRRIGSGGMAEVFLARTTVAQGLTKELVIKKIHPAFARARHFVSMFVDEAKIALGLNHPNIVQVFDFGAVGDTFFLAMEYIDGVDMLRVLQAALPQGRSIPLGLAAYVVQQVARALDYAHRKQDEFGQPLGIVHRDISPQNLLLSWDGAVKIVDFGIARARGVHEEEGVIKGKYAYMSPEQARGELVDGRSDVYSAGVLLFELVCRRPLVSGRGKDALARVQAGIRPRPREYAPQIPPLLEDIILRALAASPQDRYESARALYTALGTFLFEYALEHAEAEGALIDSETLAQFLAALLPTRMDDPASTAAAALLARAPASARARALLHPLTQTLSESVPGIRPEALPGALPDRFPEPLSMLPAVGPIDIAAASPAPPTAPRAQRERKHVMVLQGRLCGLAQLQASLGESRVARLTTELARATRDVAFKRHGLVYGMSGGIFGSDRQDGSMTVLLGLPVAREDDASQAIRLALDLIDLVDGIGGGISGHLAGTEVPELRLAVGIQRGVVVVTRTRRGTTTIDLPPTERSLARQLAHHARGGDVLVGSQVYRPARSDWNFEPYGWAPDEPSPDSSPDAPRSAPAVSTGSPAAPGPSEGHKDEHSLPRMRLYRLRGPKQRADRLREQAAATNQLVGRDLELKALRDSYLHMLTTGRPRQIVLVGEAGVGKRSLVNTFLAGIPPGEAVILRAPMQVATSLSPYAIVTDLAQELLGLSGNEAPSTILEHIETVAQVLYPGGMDSREARGAAAAVGMLLGVRLPGEPQGFDAQELRLRLIEVIRHVKQHISRDRSLIVLVEDMHRADDESTEMFREVVAGSLPLLAVVTTQPEPRIERMAQELGADILRIEELDPETSIQLVTRRLVPEDTGCGASPLELGRQIVRHTGGNPFFMVEMLDSLRERGLMAAEPPDSPHAGRLRWIAPELSIPVPTSVETLLATRIDRLPPSDKQALTRAAVLGRLSRADTVSALLNRPAAAHLDALRARGFLTKCNAYYQFRNEISMTVAYRLIPPGERSGLHRRAAQIIAGSPGYRQGQDDGIIARHLELAGDAIPAADRYLSAATHAADVGGNADALRLLERALALVPGDDHGRRFQLHAQREELYRRQAGRRQQLREIHAMRASAAALVAAGEAGAVTGDEAAAPQRAAAAAGQLAQAYIRLATFYLEVSKAPAIGKIIGPALKHARASGDPLTEAEVLRLQATMHRKLGQGDSSLALCDQALTLCDRSRAGIIQRAGLLTDRGSILWHMGKLEPAIEAHAESLVIYRMLGLPRSEVRALNNMGIIFAVMGEYEEALAHFKSALAIDQQLGDRRGLIIGLGNIGHAYSDIGDLDRGETYLGKAIHLAKSSSDATILADCLMSLGQVYWKRENHQGALALMERALELAGGGRDRYQEVRALVYLARVRTEVGKDPEELGHALALARTATEKAESMFIPVGQVYGLAMQGLALLRLGRAAEATEATAAAVRLQSAQSRPPGADEILYIHATVCEAAGRLPEARQAIAQAQRELDTQASHLADPQLRALYQSSKLARAIIDTRARLDA